MTDPRTVEGLEATTTIVRQAVREAAAIAAAGYRRPLVVEHKGPVDLVTSFDRASEALLRERLAALPFAIVGEEAGGVRSEAPTFFVDPIDGTTNFVHGHPFWCVSVGLVVEGVPILGVVFAPALGIEWYGWTAHDGTRRATRSATGPFPGEAPCVTSKTEAFDAALLATGFPYDRTSPENNFDAFVAIKRQCRAVRRCGSAALDLCLVADGTYDGYWERKLGPWDIAGGTALVRAAGGTVTDFDGGARYIETGRVIAGNVAIHARLSQALARVTPA